MTELLNETKMLINRAQSELQEMMNINKQAIELSERMTAL